MSFIHILTSDHANTGVNSKYTGTHEIFRDFTIEFYLSTANHLPLSLDISAISIRNMPNIFQSQIICYGICKLNYVNNNWLQIESSTQILMKLIILSRFYNIEISLSINDRKTPWTVCILKFWCSISFGLFLTNPTSANSFRFFLGKQLKVCHHSTNQVNKPSRRNVNHLSNSDG